MTRESHSDIRSNHPPVILSRCDAISNTYPVAPALVISIIALTTQLACLLPIPLAVYPEIEPGSGSIIEICDQSGEPIRTKGLMIVNRQFYGGPLKGAPSNSLVDISDGTAQVPVEFAMSSVFLLVGLWSAPTPYIWRPCAFTQVVGGVGHPSAIILVPGFDVEVCSWVTPEDNEPSKVVLFTKPATQAKSWQRIHDCLRRRHEDQNSRSSFDLRFDHYHYWKARNFIEAELARLQNEPAADHPEITNTQPTGPSDHD